MCTTPLSNYFTMGGRGPHFKSNCTALWRGYIGTWEVLNDRLYLVDLEGILKDGSAASLETFFPHYPDRVFAHWYSGTIRVPKGKQLEYVHSGYASIFERDLLLDVLQGVVLSARVRHNGTATSGNELEGYGVAAMTTFTRNPKDKEEKA